MNLVEYYKEVLKSFDLLVTEDDFITLNNERKRMWEANGKVIVLPTREHISTLMSEDDDGKPVVNKILFNPLDENVIKGDSVSIKKMKDLVEYKVSHSLAAAGGLLLRVQMNKKQSTPMYIQTLLASLSEADSVNTTKIVDDTTLNNWDKVYAASIKHKKGFIKMFLKKSGVGKDGVKHNRLATVKFPLYEELCKLEKGGELLGVKLRNKDVKVFKLLFKYLLKDDVLDKIETHSDSGESPAFISLMTMYLRLNKFIVKVVKALKMVDQELYDTGYIDIGLSEQDLDIDNLYTAELSAIPSDLDINRNLNNVTKSSIADVTMNQNTVVNTPVNPLVVQQPVVQPPVQQQQQTVSVPEQNNTLAAMDRALYGSRPTTVINQQQQPVQQQMLLPQMQLQSSHTPAVTAGINTLLNTGPTGVQHQQVMHQNMYQQPQQMYPPQQMQQQQQMYPPQQMQQQMYNNTITGPTWNNR